MTISGSSRSAAGSDEPRKSQQQHARIGARAGSDLSGLHIAVTNAGITLPAPPAAELTFGKWEPMRSVDLGGVFYEVRTQAPAMLRAGGGAIVAVSSLAGVRGPAGMASVCRHETWRFIVIDWLYEEFAAKFTEAFTVARPADPFAEGTLLGPLSSVAAAERLGEQVDRAKKQGATVVAEGSRSGTFFGPTVLADVSEEMDAYHEEFFGPVASLYRVEAEEEAVLLANDTPFGLGSYVYTTDQEQALRVADAIDAGMVWINLVLGDAAELPFGGVKRSGSGREMGRCALEEFINKKLIRIR